MVVELIYRLMKWGVSHFSVVKCAREEQEEYREKKGIKGFFFCWWTYARDKVKCMHMCKRIVDGYMFLSYNNLRSGVLKSVCAIERFFYQKFYLISFYSCFFRGYFKIKKIIC